MEIGKVALVTLIVILVVWLERVYRVWADEFARYLAIDVEANGSDDTSDYAYNDECAVEI